MTYDGDYANIHTWLKTHHGKASKCENESCLKKTKTFNWALKKGYKHFRDCTHYMQLCVSCHRYYDFTEEARRNLHLSHVGVPRPDKYKPIVQLHGEEVLGNFESIQGAAKALNISRTGIQNVLSGISKTAGGFRWEYKC